MAISTGAAILGGAAVGGLLNMKAAGDAADAQTAAAGQANATQRYMYDTTRADQAPYREVGVAALDRLRERMGLSVANPSAFGVAPQTQQPSGLMRAAMGITGVAAPGTGQSNVGVPWTDNSLRSADELMSEDPSYQFRLRQGEQGINRSAASGSGLLSGATMKALARYNQDFASNEFQNSFNRLSALAGVGQNATNAIGAAGQNYANNVSANQLGAGNARAAGYIGQGNSLTNALGMGINAFQNDQMMGKFSGMGTSTNQWTPGTMMGLRASPNMMYRD